MTLLEILLVGPAYVVGVGMVLAVLEPVTRIMAPPWPHRVALLLAVIAPAFVLWIAMNGEAPPPASVGPYVY